jgi:nitrogen fixation-related uncharacterized protein
MLNNKRLDDNDKGESAKRILRSDEETKEAKETEINKIKFN